MTTTTACPFTLTELADAAHQAVREINHATLWPSTLTPQEVATTLGSLALLGHGLGQACTQLGRTLTRALDSYDTYDDTGGDPLDTVADATHHLHQAAALTHQLACHLDQAHAAANHLGHHPLDDDQDDDDQDDDDRDDQGGVSR